MGLLHLLRTVHIVLGTFWVGGVVLLAFFVVPSIQAAGLAGGAVMTQLTSVRRLPAYLTAAGVLTVLSGIGLYWRDSEGFRSEWMASGPGLGFGLGGLVAVAALVLGLAVNAPGAQRLGAIMAAIAASGGSPTPEQAAEIGRLRTRLQRAAVLGAVLVLVATAMMAVARYLP